MQGKLKTGMLMAVIATGMLLARPAPTVARDDNRPPLAVRLVLYKTSLLLEKKDYAGALKVIEKFQDRHQPGKPDTKGYHHSKIFFAKGNCLLFQKKYAAAADAFGRAVKADPEFSAAWLNLARACYELKRYAQAGNCFEKAYLAADEKKPGHLYFSALSSMLAGNYPLAVTRFEKLMAAHRQAVKPAWRENFVQALLAAGKPRRALPLIKELAATCTGEKQVRWQEILIYQYLSLEMKSEALALARRLTAQAPTVARWWKALAHLELERQDYRQALVALVVYSYLSPLKDRERKLLADLYLQVGIPAKAAAWYNACLAEKPRPSLVRCLAVAYQQMGKTHAALETIQRFAAGSNDPAIMLIRADLLYRMEHWQQAAEAYRTVAKTDRRHRARAWLMTGYAAWQAGDLETSRRAFKMAARHSRQRKMALAALDQLREAQAQ